MIITVLLIVMIILLMLKSETNDRHIKILEWQIKGLEADLHRERLKRTSEKVKEVEVKHFTDQRNKIKL